MGHADVSCPRLPGVQEFGTVVDYPQVVGRHAWYLLEQRRRDVHAVGTAAHDDPFERRRLRGAGAAGAARRQRYRVDGAQQCCCCSECCSSHLGSSPDSYGCRVARATTRATRAVLQRPRPELCGVHARLQLSALACLLVSLQASSGARGRVSPPEKALRCTRHRCIKRRKLVDGNLKELSCHRSQKAITQTRVHSDATQRRIGVALRYCSDSSDNSRRRSQ